MKAGKYSIKNQWSIGKYVQGEGNELFFKDKLVAYLNSYKWIVGKGQVNSYSTGTVCFRPDEVLK